VDKDKKESAPDDQSAESAEQLLRLFMQKLMGRSLDLARISGMSDRSFDQYKKNIKDDYYQTLEHFIQLFKDMGISK
jgi:hypothetical protein